MSRSGHERGARSWGRSGSRGGRSTRPSPGAPAVAGGTPTPTTTWPNTALTSAKSTSSGARRGCGSRTRGCSATSRAPACSRSARARPRARGGCCGRARGRWRSTSPRGMLRHAAAPGPVHRRSGAARPGGRHAAAVPRRRVRPRVLGVRRRAVRGRSRAGDARGGQGAAARRALGVRGEPPDALDVLRRPRPGRAGGAAVLLRPHALRRGGRPRRRHLRGAPPHARRPRARRRRRGPGAGGPRRAGMARGARHRVGPVVRLRGELFPGTAIFCCRKPG